MRTEVKFQINLLSLDFTTPARRFERVKLCLDPNCNDRIKREYLWTTDANSAAEKGPRSSPGEAPIIFSTSASLSFKARGFAGMNCKRDISYPVAPRWKKTYPQT